MAKHFAVTIQAADTAVDMAQVARRVAELVGCAEGEVEAALRHSLVIVQRELSYGEALEFQRELGRRRIPSQVRADVNLEGMELFERVRSVEEGSVGDEVGQASEFIEVEEVEDLPWFEESEGLESSDDEEEGVESAWGELFPDLAVDDEQGSEAKVEESKDEEEARADFGEGQEVVEAAFVERSSEVLADVAVEPSSVERFDGRQIQEAFASVEDERPPFQPHGFDSGPVHIPLFAALLTAIAPGAGQVYNGQPEEAARLALRFILIKPWIDGVRQAWEYGEKVHTYYAPRPEPGALKRAFLFGLKWWASVVVVVSLSVWTISMVQEHRAREQEQMLRGEVQRLIYVTQDLVFDGLEAGEVAAEEAEAARQAEQEQGMSKEERARRLFIVGYHYCLAKEYAMCAATMGRVTALARDNREAFRLQTWASVQARGSGEEVPMPEVGEVPTLEDFELELSLRGEDVDDLLEAKWADEGGEEGRSVIRIE